MAAPGFDEFSVLRIFDDTIVRFRHRKIAVAVGDKDIAVRGCDVRPLVGIGPEMHPAVETLDEAVLHRGRARLEIVPTPARVSRRASTLAPCASAGCTAPWQMG